MGVPVQPTPGISGLSWFAILHTEPRPARPKPSRSRLRKCFAERVKPSEIAVDGRGQIALRLAPALRRHHLPEEVVVPESAAVVAHGRDLRVAAQQVLDGLALHRRTGNRRVQIRRVGRVVLAVVDLHRLRIDVRFECVVRIGQRGKFECHGEKLGGFRGEREPAISDDAPFGMAQHLEGTVERRVAAQFGFVEGGFAEEVAGDLGDQPVA